MCVSILFTMQIFNFLIKVYYFNYQWNTIKVFPFWRMNRRLASELYKRLLWFFKNQDIPKQSECIYIPSENRKTK